MPNALCGPRGAITTEVDATEWAGVTLFTVGLNSAVAPSDWTTFRDVIDLLNGRGCGQVFYGAGAYVADLATDASTATGTTVTADINRDDRIVLTFTGATAVTLAAGAGNAAWGFDPAGQAAALVGGNYVLTAVSDWQRGNVQNQQLSLTRGASSGLAPADAYRTHTLVLALRQWGSADLDDTAPTSNVQHLDSGASWGVDADGHVWRAWDVGLSAAPTWVSTTFRDALGFTGQEASTSDGDLRILTATYPCRWLLTPSRPWEAVLRARDSAGSAVRASDRGAYSVTWSQWDRLDVTGYIDGPADRIDRQDHWLRDVWPYMPPGGLVTLYQDWGDGRRGRRTADTGPQASGGLTLPYSTLYTSQRDGEYGRWLCRLDVEASRLGRVQWAGRMQRRSEVQMSLTAWEGVQ